MEQEVQNVETETTATENVENNSENVVEKTFTQEEVDAKGNATNEFLFFFSSVG